MGRSILARIGARSSLNNDIWGGVSWLRGFDEPIPLPDGREMVATRDAAAFVTALPQRESAPPPALMRVADLGVRRCSPSPL